MPTAIFSMWKMEGNVFSGEPSHSIQHMSKSSENPNKNRISNKRKSIPIHKLKSICDSNLPALSWNKLILKNLKIIQQSHPKMWLVDLLDGKSEMSEDIYKFLKKELDDMILQYKRKTSK